MHVTPTIRNSDCDIPSRDSRLSSLEYERERHVKEPLQTTLKNNVAVEKYENVVYDTLSCVASMLQFSETTPSEQLQREARQESESCG